MRTRAANHAKRARGHRAGRLAPYGYRVNGDGRTLHPYEPEQRIIMLMQDCAAAGYSQRAIESDLNRAGFTTAPANLDAISTFASAFDTQHPYRQPRQQGRDTWPFGHLFASALLGDIRTRTPPWLGFTKEAVPVS